VPYELLIEEECLMQAADVVESHAVRVIADGPDEHDVLGEGASLVCCPRNEDCVRLPAVDR
jgi:hypothetical protein